jgi:hypothetical protein
MRNVSGKSCRENKKLHHEEHNDLYSSPNIVRMINSRRLECPRHVAEWERGEACTGIWWGNLRERDQWGDTGVDERIILRWIFKK